MWVGERKIAAIGVQISHGITRHGSALNVSTDLASFDSIVPCGVADKEVTSLQRELGRKDLVLDEVAGHFVAHFMHHFRFTECQKVDRTELEE